METVIFDNVSAGGGKFTLNGVKVDFYPWIDEADESCHITIQNAAYEVMEPDGKFCRTVSVLPLLSVADIREIKERCITHHFFTPQTEQQ